MFPWCQTAENMVNRHIEHDLSVDELENFLEHVENCPSCYDELETYFIVHAAMQQLDDESRDSSLDLRELLEEDIRRSSIISLKDEIPPRAEWNGILCVDCRTGWIFDLYYYAGIIGNTVQKLICVKILLIDGHSIFKQGILRTSGSG